MSLPQIIKNYPISEYLDERELENTTDIDSLTLILFPAVQRLFHEAPEILLNTLYRIDVDEQLAKKALEEGKTENRIAGVSRLIAERLIRKMEFRKKYGHR